MNLGVKLTTRRQFMKKSQTIRGKNVKIKSYAIDQLVISFDQYLDNTRGFAPETRKKYCRNVTTFLCSQSNSNKLNINSLKPKDIYRFFLEYTKVGGKKRAQKMVYPLRIFFTYLKHRCGLKDDLKECVPTVPVWKKNKIIKTLSVDEVRRLLDSCDRSTPKGVRDFAVLTLMTNLGLRAFEVVHLKPSDIDWFNGRIIIHGKGAKISELPLFQDVGDALVDYLSNVRPTCSIDRIFLCMTLPHRGFQSSSTVSTILHAAIARTGLNPPTKGTHLLRHSFATHLLQQGGSLQEVGAILRHEDLFTTSIYAAIDPKRLLELTLPWPCNHKKGGQK